MPTILTHAAVPLALRLGLGGKTVPARLLACGAIASMIPDLDVIGMRLGVAYSSDFGHRGFTHSLLFAALVALAGACFHRRLRRKQFPTGPRLNPSRCGNGPAQRCGT